jgi:ribosomal protein L37E
MSSTCWRTHIPCRVCGNHHHNLRSSSICPTCGAAEAAENAAEKERDERENASNKYNSFEEAQTVEELKDWIREYML